MKKPRSGAALLVAAGILLSRIAGLVRERVFASFFGVESDVADAFRTAVRIPNFLQNLLGEGVLSASFIPVYAKLIADQKELESGKVAGAVFAILSVAVSLLVLVGIAVTPWLMFLIAPGFAGEKRDLTIELVRVLFPGVGALVFSAWCLGILNSHKRFFLSYSAPVLWNAAMIGGLIYFGPRANENDLAVKIAWVSVAGSTLQFLVQLPTVARLAPFVTIAWDTTSQNVTTVIRNFGPVFLSRGVAQVSGYIDNMLATLLGTGAVNALSYAQTISMLPVSLFGMAVSASELPAMSQASGSTLEIAAYLRSRLESGLLRIAFFVIPSAAAFAILGNVIAGALFQTGRFKATDSNYLWGILAGSAVGLLASTQSRLYSSAFYALRDTRTPLRFAVVRVILTTVLGYLFAKPFPYLLGLSPHWGVAGLTSSAGISGWVEFVLLKRALGIRIGPLLNNTNSLTRLWLAAVGAAGFSWLVKSALPPLHPVITAVIVLGTYGTVYLGACGPAYWKLLRR